MQFSWIAAGSLAEDKLSMLVTLAFWGSSSTHGDYVVEEVKGECIAESPHHSTAEAAPSDEKRALVAIVYLRRNQLDDARTWANSMEKDTFEARALKEVVDGACHTV